MNTDQLIERFVGGYVDYSEIAHMEPTDLANQMLRMWGEFTPELGEETKHESWASLAQDIIDTLKDDSCPDCGTWSGIDPCEVCEDRDDGEDSY